MSGAALACEAPALEPGTQVVEVSTTGLDYAHAGVVRTRFPPEPNGYLHVGHAKSMNMNFSLAFERLEQAGLDGSKFRRETVFRFDDTNPEAETKEFIDSLRTDVAWLGWAPVRTTHTSDYFPACETRAGPRPVPTPAAGSTPWPWSSSTRAT